MSIETVNAADLAVAGTLPSLARPAVHIPYTHSEEEVLYERYRKYRDESYFQAKYRRYLEVGTLRLCAPVQQRFCLYELAGATCQDLYKSHPGCDGCDIEKLNGFDHTTWWRDWADYPAMVTTEPYPTLGGIFEDQGPSFERKFPGLKLRINETVSPHAPGSTILIEIYPPSGYRDFHVPRAEDSFTDWLQTTLRCDVSTPPIRELARAVARDRDWPSDHDDSLKDLLQYLYGKGAGVGAGKALRSAWAQYKAYCRKHGIR
jgi:hypothetical protein